MKNYLILLFLTCTLVSCGIYNKKELSYNLPRKTVKLTAEEFLLKKEFQSGRIGIVFKEFYQIDDVLVAFSQTRNENFDANMLVRHKDGLSNLANDPSIKPNSIENYTSRIEKIGNNQVLIQKYDYSKDKKYYEFEIINNDFTKQKLGIIQFSKEDDKKANSILINLLKNFQF